jgi:hypothetical protein
MIPPHMSKSIHTGIATLQSSARGIMSVAVLAIGVSACHHSAPAPSMIMTPVPRDQAHTEATRAQLQELAVTTEADAGKAPDATTRQQKQMQAATIRARLRDGDFDVGDRILLSVRGDSTISDTVTVRAGRMIRLENIPDISLQGVLRSELQDYLTTQLSRYIKRPDVQTTSLVRVAVMGSVA